MSARDVDNNVGIEREGDGSNELEAALRRALNEPPSDDELAGWDAVATAYRSTLRSTRPRRLRLAAALPLSAATAAAVLLPAGAVAAAYTGRLPAHVQHWAHRALAPIGVPSHRHPTTGRAEPHRASSPASPLHEYVPRRHAAVALPEPQHARAVQLCVVLSRTPHERQQPALTALHRLLPQEPDLHQACRILLSPRATPVRTGASPSPRPSATPSGGTQRSPAPTATPSPGTSSHG